MYRSSRHRPAKQGTSNVVWCIANVQCETVIDGYSSQNHTLSQSIRRILLKLISCCTSFRCGFVIFRNIWDLFQTQYNFAYC